MAETNFKPFAKEPGSTRKNLDRIEVALHIYKSAQLSDINRWIACRVQMNGKYKKIEFNNPRLKKQSDLINEIFSNLKEAFMMLLEETGS